MLRPDGAGRYGGRSGRCLVNGQGAGFVVVRVLLVVALAASVLQFAHGPAAAQADTEAPTLVSATIAHGRLVLTYNEALHTGQTPHWRWFTARVTAPAARARTLEFNAVVVSGKTLTATMPLTKSEGVDSAAVVAGETVVVSYDHSEPQGSAQPIRDAAGNRAAALTDRAVENLTDPSPVVASARVLRDSLSITFDRPLVGSEVPDGGQFTVGLLRDGAMLQIQVPQGERVPQGEGWVSVDGSTVTVRLSDGVRPSDTGVTVSYSHSSGSTSLTKHMRGAGDAGGVVAPFSNQAVVNATAPAPTGAVFTDNSLLLTFDAPLDPGEVPDRSQFAVTYDEFGTTSKYFVKEGGVAVSGRTVTLTLTVNASDRFPLLELDYMRTVPGGSGVSTALRGVGDSGEVLPFTDLAVTLSPRPRLVATGGAVVDSSTLTLTFDKALDDGADHVPDKSQFTVTVTPAGDTAQDNAVTTVAVSGQTVTLTLTSTVAADSSVLVSYSQTSPSADLTKKLRGATAPYPLVAAFTKLDLARPVLVATGGAMVDSSTLTLTFDKALDDGSDHMPDKSQFTVAVTPADGSMTQVNAVTAVAVSGQKVTLTLTTPVAAGSSATVSYSQDSPSSDLTKMLRGATAPNPLVAAFSGFVIEVADTTAPMLAATGGAVVAGSTLTLVFDAALDEGSQYVPHHSQFAVSVTDAAVAVTADGVSVAGAEVTLTLASAAAAADTVTVSYSKMATGGETAQPLRAAVTPNTEAAAFSDQAVTNVTPPALVSASVNGDTLELVFDVELDDSAANRPTWPQFAAAAGPAGEANPVSVYPVTADDGVAVAGKTVTLKLRSPVGHGDTVTVRYSHTNILTSSTAVLLRGANGAAVAAFSNRAVANGTALALASASVNGDTLVLVFNAALDDARMPHHSQFAVSVTDAAVAVTAGGVSVAGAEVTLTLASAVAAADTVTVGYSKAAAAAETAQPLRAAVTPNAEADEFTDRAVTNVTPPVVVSASVDGDTLELVFDVELDASAANRPTWPQFFVTVTTPDSIARTMHLVTAADGVAVAGKTLTLRLPSPVRHGDTLAVDYSQTRTSSGSTAALLRGANGAAVAAFNNVVVTNNTPPAPPALSGATIGASVLVLAFDGMLDTSRVPGWGQFEASITTSDGIESKVYPSDLSGVGVRVSRDSVTLILTSGAAAYDTVTVAYSRDNISPTATDDPVPLRGANESEVAEFSGEPVDKVPDVVSASVDATTLTLMFDAALDAAAVPHHSQFTVTVTPAGGTAAPVAVAPDGVAIEGAEVALTLASAVATGDTVTVSYSRTAEAGATKVLLLAAGGAPTVNTFTGVAVTNNTPVPAPPAPVSASVDATVLTLVFDAALDGARVPHLSQFSVMVTPSGGSAADVAVASGGVLVSGAEVALTLASAVAAGDAVTVGYSQAADAGATAVLLRAAPTSRRTRSPARR